MIFAVHKRSGIVHRTETEDGLFVFTLCGKRVTAKYTTTHEKSLDTFGLASSPRCAKCDVTYRKRLRRRAA